MKAYIGNIQHFNVHDGNGIRTNVFFQGCALNCKWCQNPELQSMKPILMYNKELCVECGLCRKVCRNSAIQINSRSELVTDTRKCQQCFMCEEECFYLARQFSSKKMSVEFVYKEVMKDKYFFQKSGGGVTFSGGEPLLRIEFCLQLIKLLNAVGVPVNIETAGFVSWQSIERIVPYVDTFLYDLKLIDKNKQKYWLGTGSSLILHNLKKLSKIHNRIVIRIPLIPKVNDANEDFERMMDFVDTLKTIKFIHILPFHQLGSRKYELIGKIYDMLLTNVENEIQIKVCADIAQKHGYLVDIGGTAFS